MLLPLLFAAAALASDPTPTVKVGGLIFPRWSLDTTAGAAGANAFALDRTYLRVEARLDDHLGARVTVDSRRDDALEVPLPDGTTAIVDVDDRYGVFVKQAWLELRPTEALTARFGLIDTPILSFLESWQGHRWIHKTFLDDVDLASSADYGANLSGKHADGLFSWVAGVYSGETYKDLETGAGKSFQARATVDPLARADSEWRLPLSGFVNEDLQQEGLPATTTWTADVGFDHPNLLIDLQVAGTTTDGVSGLGESAQVSPGVPKIGYVLFRFDHWDPNGGAANDDTATWLAGPAHDFRDKVSAGAFYTRTTGAGEPAASAVSVQAQVGF